MAGIRISGLKELQGALRDADRTLPRQLRVANKEAATTVHEIGEQHANFYGGSVAKAYEVGSFKVFAEQRKAGVRIRTGGGLFGFGAEFGAKKFRQFLPWKGSGADAGYTIHPAIRDKADEIRRAYEQAIHKLLRDVGE